MFPHLDAPSTPDLAALDARSMAGFATLAAHPVPDSECQAPPRHRPRVEPPAGPPPTLPVSEPPAPPRDRPLVEPAAGPPPTLPVSEPPAPPRHRPLVEPAAGQPPTGRALAALRHGLDMLIAFAILRDAADRLRADRAPGPPPAGRALAALRHGLDVLIAFATLRDAEALELVSDADLAHAAAPRRRAHPSRSAAVAATHPHRRPLRPPARPGRPGAVLPPSHACVTPLAPARPARRADRAGPRP